MTKERYASGFTFEDPVTRITGVDQFASYLQVLRSVFAISFDVHSIKPKGATELVTRYACFPCRSDILPLGCNCPRLHP